MKLFKKKKLFQDNDANSDKQVQLCAFLVTILEKMCESYAEYLNDMYLFNMLDLLIALNKYQTYYLSKISIRERLILLITKHVTSKIDSFLAILMDNPNFKKVHIKFENKKFFKIKNYHGNFRRTLDVASQFQSTTMAIIR